MSRFGGKTPSNHDDTTPNDYEQQRLRHIKSNKLKMQTLGIKRIAACVTSLVDSSKPQKRRQKCNFTLEKDGDYVPDEDEEDEREDQTQIMTTNKKVRSTSVFHLVHCPSIMFLSFFCLYFFVFSLFDAFFLSIYSFGYNLPVVSCRMLLYFFLLSC